MLGINAARLGMESKIFYSFMGLNLVMKGGAARAKFFPPGVMGAIPGVTTLATGMMKKKIDKANIPSLADMQEMAQLEGVALIACKMTIDMMEIDDHRHDGDQGGQAHRGGCHLECRGFHAVCEGV